MGRRWTRVAWSMLAVFAVGYLAVPLSSANGNVQREPGFYLALAAAFTAFMAVGVVIVAHRPGNALGWVFSAIGLLSSAGVLTMEYAEYAYLTHPSLPGATLAAWFSWWWLPILGLIFVFTLLLFPTGRLPAPPTRRTAPSGPCCSVCWPPARWPRSSRWCCASAAPLGREVDVRVAQWSDGVVDLRHGRSSRSRGWWAGAFPPRLGQASQLSGVTGQELHLSYREAVNYEDVAAAYRTWSRSPAAWP